MPENIDIDELVKDREAFNKFVYTSLNEAIEELEIRWKDYQLKNEVDSYLNYNIPYPLIDKPKVVLFRQLFTPNYEFLRYRNVIDVLDIEPVFWGYYDDKFTPNNSLKRYLGKMPINKGIGKKGGAKVEYKNIINFNESNGKKIKDVKTIWGQSLIDFHHELLNIISPNMNQYLFDASEWFHSNNGFAKDYYKNYVTLFVRNAILFENFILDGEELEFTKNIFLPAFIEVYKKTGKKPLIVALEPTEIEGDLFWLSYPTHVSNHIEKKKNFSWYNKVINYLWK